MYVIVNYFWYFHSEIVVPFQSGFKTTNCQKSHEILKIQTKNLDCCDAGCYVINRIVSQHYERDNKLTKKATKLGL